jgi:hypothetical protein
MKRKRSGPPPIIQEERIRRLKDKLDELRRNVIHSVPDKFQEMLTRWGELEPDFKPYMWQIDLVNKVIENTEVIPAANEYSKDRARCPLCNGCPELRSDGFAFPIGLGRHLDGYGNQRQCHVVRAALDIVQERHFDKYPERYPHLAYWD